MEVLVSQKFNEAMKELSKSSQQKVMKLFSFINKAEKEEMATLLFIKVNSKNNDLFILQDNNIQIYCTFIFQENKTNLIFLTVVSVDDV